jgi:hypothetical protein
MKASIIDESSVFFEVPSRRLSKIISSARIWKRMATMRVYQIGTIASIVREWRGERWCEWSLFDGNHIFNYA